MNKKLKVAATTLGCKVNMYDTEAMVAMFRAKGYEVVDFDEKADIYLVNTCTVTNFGDKKSRQMLRKAKKTNPAAIVVAAGCYAQAAPEEIEGIDGVNILIGTKERSRVVEIVEQYKLNSSVYNCVSDIMQERAFENLNINHFQDRTRAYIKIQEGCDRFCTYCVIPYARGPVRSREPHEIIGEVQRLRANGYKEIVLTGIHIASYGKDLKNTNLSDILQKVHDIDGIERIRFSSIEPTVVTDEFIALLSRLPKVCNHFHLSLQSGSDNTLKAMNRHYTKAAFAQAVEKIRTIMPDAAITTDIIVGFPGETEEDFEESYEFARQIKLAKIHVFPYSPKKGTKAAAYDNQIPSHIKEERSKKMIALGEKMQKDFIKLFKCKNLDILFERQVDENIYEGYSTNYIHAKTFSTKCIENEILRLKVLHIKEFTAITEEI